MAIFDRDATERIIRTVRTVEAGGREQYAQRRTWPLGGGKASNTIIVKPTTTVAARSSLTSTSIACGDCTIYQVDTTTKQLVSTGTIIEDVFNLDTKDKKPSGYYEVHQDRFGTYVFSPCCCCEDVIEFGDGYPLSISGDIDNPYFPSPNPWINTAVVHSGYKYWFDGQGVPKTSKVWSDIQGFPSAPTNLEQGGYLPIPFITHTPVTTCRNSVLRWNSTPTSWTRTVDDSSIATQAYNGDHTITLTAYGMRDLNSPYTNTIHDDDNGMESAVITLPLDGTPVDIDLTALVQYSLDRQHEALNRFNAGDQFIFPRPFLKMNPAWSAPTKTVTPDLGKDLDTGFVGQAHNFQIASELE